MSQALITHNLPIPSALGSLDAYISSVNRIPVLSPDDEQALARQYLEQEDLSAGTSTGVVPFAFCRACGAWL
jgi:RNA polymerase sigma-32 factor